MDEFKGNLKRTESAETQNKKPYTKLHFERFSFNIFDEKMIEGIHGRDNLRILYEEEAKDDKKYWNVKAVEKMPETEEISAGKSAIDDYALFKECVSAVQDAYGVNAKDMPEIVQSINCIFIERCRKRR